MPVGVVGGELPINIIHPDKAKVPEVGTFAETRNSDMFQSPANNSTTWCGRIGGVLNRARASYEGQLWNPSKLRFPIEHSLMRPNSCLTTAAAIPTCVYTPETAV